LTVAEGSAASARFLAFSTERSAEFVDSAPEPVCYRPRAEESICSAPQGIDFLLLEQSIEGVDEGFLLA